MKLEKLYKILITIFNWIKGNKKLLDQIASLVYEIQVLISDIKDIKEDNKHLHLKIKNLKDENKRFLKTTRKAKL